MIPFNCPHFTGREMDCIQDVFRSGNTAGNFAFTRRCQAFFESRYGFMRALLTTSCTDALELAALLSGVGPGDEVIIPSFGFVSTANAFALRGATVLFADSSPDHPNICLASVTSLITQRTRVICPIHYAGVAVDMDALLALAQPLGILLVEDAAQGIEASLRGRPLGGIGHIGALSFHETKNIHSGEGGLLMVNRIELVPRAEIMWEKGTNRAAFFRGEVAKYSWVDLGSSFTPSDILAAVLWAQLQEMEAIQSQRMARWQQYAERLQPLTRENRALLPVIPDYAQHNAHIFYLVTHSLEERTALIEYLKARGIHAVFHYQSLHKSAYYASRHKSAPLPNAERFSDCLIRLPLWSDLTSDQVDQISDAVLSFYQTRP